MLILDGSVLWLCQLQLLHLVGCIIYTTPSVGHDVDLWLRVVSVVATTYGYVAWLVTLVAIDR